MDMTAEWIAPVLFAIASLLILVLSLTGRPCRKCGEPPEKDEAV
jgi:hypothetical protein